MQSKIIAIDGYSSTGKSSLSKKVAQELGYIHIDTGAMYRAISLYALNHNMIDDNGTVHKMELIAALPSIQLNFVPNNISGINEIHLNGKNVEKEIRSMEVSQIVSQVAKIPEVRSHLVRIQRNLAKEKGIVMDGRDIGTVVFPDAPVKIFLTASPHVRAKRRYDEMLSHGSQPNLQEVHDNLIQRDKIDSERATSPLVKAQDAVEINNDELDRQQTLEAVLRVIAEKGLS